MDKVRLGYVKYLNTLPLVEGLDACEDLALTAAAPARLAGMLREGAVDLALASIVDVVAGAGDEPLALVPAGMIGCDGPTLTVRLFSAVPWERVTTIHADAESHTSVVLARVILAKKYGVRVETMPFDAHATAATAPQTMLLIGDKVVTDAPPAVRYPHQLDLGEEWKSLTGLPFVYAMWMCRAADAESPRIASAAALLDRQRRRNTMRLGWLIDRHAAARGWTSDLAHHYVTDLLRYEVGPHERAGAERFLAEAAGLGLLPHAPIKWIELHSASALAASAS